MRKLIYLVLVVLLAGCGSKEENHSLELTLPSLSFGNKAESGTANITASDSWTASISPASASSWLQIDKTSGGVGSTTVKFSVVANPGEARSATVEIEMASIKKTVNVTQASVDKITLTPAQKTYTIGAAGEVLTITAECASMIEVLCPSWISHTLTKSQDKYTIILTVGLNSGAARNGTVSLQGINGSLASESITVNQAVYDPGAFYSDGEIVTLASATIGNGVDLVFMGEGFTLQDMARGGNSKYEKSVKQAVEHYFAVEPYKSYRSHFNIYMIAAVSNQSGITNEPWGTTYDTKFSVRYTENQGTGITCNTTLCETWAKTIPNIDPSKDLSIILVLNSTKYAGTCWMRADGLSIAMCPMSRETYPWDFRGVVQHEAGGHGFGRFADEYINYQGTAIPSADATSQKNSQTAYGWQRNIDFTSDITKTWWKDFAGLAKYPAVGTFEGAGYYSYGVWRAENTNCMINNIPYYNAHCRYLITQRIMTIAGRAFTFADFVATDNVAVLASVQTKVPEKIMPPLAPPIMVTKW